MAGSKQNKSIPMVPSHVISFGTVPVQPSRLAQAYPHTTEALATARQLARDFAARGETARSLGAGILRPVVTAPVGLVRDVAAVPMSAIAPVARFLGGALGSSGSDAVTVASAPEAPAVVKQPVSPVDAALAAGRAAASTSLSPQERTLAAIDSILRGPVSIKDVQGLAGVFPALTKVPQTERDATIGKVAQTSEDIYQQEIKAATELAKTDLPAAQAAAAKATDAYFQRGATLVGANPLAAAQAKLLNPDDETK